MFKVRVRVRCFVVTRGHKWALYIRVRVRYRFLRNVPSGNRTRSIGFVRVRVRVRFAFCILGFRFTEYIHAASLSMW